METWLRSPSARSGWPKGVALGALVGLLATASSGEPFEPAPDVDARAVAERVEDVFRGQTSALEATMTVVSPRLPAPRRVRFRSFDDRPGDRAFIRILEPAKDEGMSFLKIDRNLWNYIPRVERTMRIPPSMMLQSWMGSDFTNDDLVRESSQLDDYDHVMLGIDRSTASEGVGASYVIEYQPHEDAAVVWGKIVSWIEMERATPLRQEFYDEAGTKLRVMEFGDIRDVQGRAYPHAWSMRPLEKPGHETRIDVSSIRFDETFDDDLFTKRNLRRGVR